MNIVEIGIDAELKSLLQRCELPIDDLADNTCTASFGIQRNGVLIACVGIERYAAVVLLR